MNIIIVRNLYGGGCKGGHLKLSSEPSISYKELPSTTEIRTELYFPKDTCTQSEKIFQALQILYAHSD